VKITHQGEIVSRNLLAFMTVGGILIFSVSAILVIFFGYTLYGKYVMGAGFIFLIIAVILLVTVYRTVASVSWRGNQLLFRKYYDDLLNRMKINNEENEI
jgi:membrane protein implicated in regulation of membrane protease activity